MTDEERVALGKAQSDVAVAQQKLRPFYDPDLGCYRPEAGDAIAAYVAAKLRLETLNEKALRLPTCEELRHQSKRRG